MFVADWMQKRVTVLSPDGRVLRTLGETGSGPGEFRAIRGVQITRGDSLLVYDPELARVTVFEPDSLSVARTETFAGRLRGAPPFRLWRATAGRYVAVFRSGFEFSSSGAVAERRDSVALLRSDGSLEETIARLPARGFLREGFSITPNPFGREPLAGANDSGRVHYVWSDSLAVHTYDSLGNLISRFAAELPPRPVTTADVDSERAAMDEWTRRTFQKALADSTPRTWPAVKDMIVDDAGRVWLQLGGPRGTLQEWVVFTPGGGYIRSVIVPDGVRLYAVRGPRLYAEQLNEENVPSVVVLTLDREL
ncbi:MAG TPA: 6-bladed beta-propeller [Longimicrobium sp.]|nr:6-bladed beta-propeller [Longimicrobium sp.]